MDVQGYATGQQTFAFPDLVSLNLLFVTSGTVTMNGVPTEVESLVYSATDGSIITITGTGVSTDGPAPSGGTVTKVTISSAGTTVAVAQDLSAPFDQVVASGRLHAEPIFAGDDTLTGAFGSDFLRGGLGADALSGGAGDDILEGGPGIDIIGGGAGNDTVAYSYLPAGKSVIVDLVSGTGKEGELLADTLSGIENVLGSSGDDTIIGNDANNIILGGQGTTSSLVEGSLRTARSYRTQVPTYSTALTAMMVSGERTAMMSSPAG